MKKAKKITKKSDKKSPKYQISVSIPIEKKKVGRPTDYNLEITKEICEVIATTSKGLDILCEENPHWPHPDVIYIWRRKHEEFNSIYAKAKADQVQVLADEILKIADDSSQDITYNEKGQAVCNTEFVNRSRLRVDTRKWICGKLAPRIYGEKMLMEQKINFDDLTPEQLRTLLDKMPESDKLKLVEAIVKDYESKNQLT